MVGRFAPDEERLVLSKPVLQFSFTYDVSRGIFIFVYTAKFVSCLLGVRLALHVRSNVSYVLHYVIF